MKQLAIALLLALVLAGCTGNLGADPTEEEEVIGPTGQNAVSAAIAAYDAENRAPFTAEIWVYNTSEDVCWFETVQSMEDVQQIMDELSAAGKELEAQVPLSSEMDYQQAANRADQLRRALDPDGLLGAGGVWRINYWSARMLSDAEGTEASLLDRGAFGCFYTISDQDAEWVSVCFSIDAVTGAVRDMWTDPLGSTAQYLNSLFEEGDVTAEKAAEYEQMAQQVNDWLATEEPLRCVYDTLEALGIPYNRVEWISSWEDAQWPLDWTTLWEAPGQRDWLQVVFQVETANAYKQVVLDPLTRMVLYFN